MRLENKNVLLEIKNLKKYFPAERALFSRAKHFVHAVDDVSFEILEGESLGLVGESGVGQTTTGRMGVRL
ncbi:MAG: ABC transporter ATP-binding protein, partial [Fervidobacterium sp.]|nr:ABC transporter ATP-binding protein [Fervidobacterium sp.]